MKTNVKNKTIDLKSLTIVRILLIQTNNLKMFTERLNKKITKWDVNER